MAAAASAPFDRLLQKLNRARNGTPRKLMDVSRLHALGWSAKTGFRDGLVVAYRDFQQGG